MERIVAVRLKAYLGNVSLQNVAPYFGIHELTNLTTPHLLRAN